MSAADPDADVVLRLPDELREAFRDPLGPLFTDPTTLLAAVEGPLVAVGDVVTYHFERVGTTPDVAVVDGRTKREAVDEAVRAAPSDDAARVAVRNPPATLSAALLSGLRDGIESDEETVLVVDGEEDLATVPAIVAAPDGASVVYGQPDEGMVHVPVTEESRSRARELLTAMDGDHERLWELLGAEA